MPERRTEDDEMERVVKLAQAATKAKQLYEDDCKARDAAIWAYDDLHGDGSIRAIARACHDAGLRLSPSHVHRIIGQETARRQAAMAERLGA
jgi:hypothetical protein